MKFTPRRMKSAPLTDREKAALREIADGGTVEMQMYERLQELGLVQKRHDGWAITHQGHIRLMFGGAR